MSPIAYSPKTDAAPSLPANFSVANARMPANYEQAKKALADCVSIDECVDWTDRAAALASYAKQANDQSLLDYARRVQARGTRRTGELLKQIEPKQGVRNDLATSGGRPPEVSRAEAAAKAGMSAHQAKQAIRVASVPAAEFEAKVETAKTPMTVTALADLGTARRPPADEKSATPMKRGKPDWMPDTRPEGFKAATELFGSVERFAEFCTKNDPEIVAAAVMDNEVQDLRRHVTTIDGWLDRFVVNLKG